MQIINNAIDPLILRSLWHSWPDPNSRIWHHYSDKNAEKYATKSHKDLPDIANRCIYSMIEAVSPYVSGDVFADLELHGAGMHMLTGGGFLSRHLDSSLMRSTGWKREYSCVLSVNPHWEDSWGGEFVLNETKVLPEFNQLTLFRCTDESFHEVLKVVGPQPRCTICVFLWSKNEQGDQIRDRAFFL
jgi:Rps23 Pro-64 3,4-dihydroxylase Tpa1-like proline 4-hydroxylase